MERTLAALVLDNAVGYAIVCLDLDGVVTSWSIGAEKVFGWTTAEALGRNFSDFFVPADQAAGADKTELETARRRGRAEDSRWHRRKDGERFWANGMTMFVQDPPVAGFLKIVRDETAAKLAENQRVLLLNELNHRIKNTLATVQSIADQTLKAHGVSDAARRDLTERLLTLSQAHNILVRESWAGADMATIAASAMSPFVQPGPQRIWTVGPDVRLSPQQAITMSLVLYELATNALKYGALSGTEGTVHLTWNLALDGEGGRHMNLLWEEADGPAVSPPVRTGFGSRLISRSFAELQGHAAVEYRPEGVRCVVSLYLSSPAEIPLLDLVGWPARGDDASEAEPAGE
jgi:PAS domain S-box-containing protein